MRELTQRNVHLLLEIQRTCRRSIFHDLPEARKRTAKPYFQQMNHRIMSVRSMRQILVREMYDIHSNYYYGSSRGGEEYLSSWTIK